MIPFRAYLRGRVHTETPQGAFCRAAARDADLPDAETWAELCVHLRRQRYTLDQIDAARAVWRSFVAARRRAARAEVAS